MNPKNPQPAFIEFANLPEVPDGLKVPDGFDYDILVSSHSNITYNKISKQRYQ